jgi:hypothetical protein
VSEVGILIAVAWIVVAYIFWRARGAIPTGTLSTE